MGDKTGHNACNDRRLQLMITIFIHTIQTSLTPNSFVPIRKTCQLVVIKLKRLHRTPILPFLTSRHPHPQNLQMPRRYPHLLASPRKLPYKHLVVFVLVVASGRRSWDVVVAVEIAVADEGVFEAVLFVTLAFIP